MDNSIHSNNSNKLMLPMVTVSKDMIIKKCQEFSPKDAVEQLLACVGYQNDIYEKKVLENSFGEGNILVGVISRYIKQGNEKGLSAAQINAGLSKNIYGYEIDESLFDSCITRLNKLTVEAGIGIVDWHNLLHADYLSADCQCKFDFIIGNPPYIDYRSIHALLRDSLKERFMSCNEGKFDFCYPFIEKSITDLADRGRMAMLVPANIYKNKFARNLRHIIKEGLISITTFPSKKLFNPSVLTSSSILVYENGNKKDSFVYTDDTNGISYKMNLSDLSDEKWIFSSNVPIIGNTATKFGDWFSVSMVVATLYNKAFIVTEEIAKTENLEEELIHPAISPHSVKCNMREQIIFPYLCDEAEKLVRIPETEFAVRYPNVTRHLLKFEDKLKNRKSDKNAHWFEYGRSQAITHMNQKKLVISTVISGSVKVYKVDKSTIPYSGIMITQKTDDHDLVEAEKLLTSDLFLEYAKLVGVTVNNGSLRLSSKDVSDFVVNCEHC